LAEAAADLCGVRRILAIAFVSLAVSVPASVGAGQLGAQIPSNCTAHVSFDGGADLVDDFRCAGVAIEFHTAGVAYSPGPIWAGQWLFTDEAGQFRVGSCTFNRGIHPTIDAPSFLVAQQFPNDPTGAKGAYLTWGYGDTTDDLRAAAMWAVFHYYAQDGAGTRRASNGAAPLVPSLGMIASASGRDDIQALAESLDAEAALFAGEWAISVALGIDGRIDVAVVAGTQPVLGARVTLLLSGQDAPVVVETDVAGLAHATMPVVSGVMTVVASTSSPGLAAVYRGSPAGPDPQGAQRLVTGGPPRILSATATVDVPIPTTTTIPPATTTTIAPTTTTVAPTTTMVAPTTTMVAPTTTTTVLPTTTSTLPIPTTTTVAPTTTTNSTTLPPETTTTIPTVAPLAEVLPPVPGPPLPKTGKGSDLISYLGTSLLVAGIGIVGTASRRPARRVIYTR
jgi:LPXTG-motif cell wall-anchored protein